MHRQLLVASYEGSNRVEAIGFPMEVDSRANYRYIPVEVVLVDRHVKGTVGTWHVFVM